MITIGFSTRQLDENYISQIDVAVVHWNSYDVYGMAKETTDLFYKSQWDLPVSFVKGEIMRKKQHRKIGETIQT